MYLLNYDFNTVFDSSLSPAEIFDRFYNVLYTCLTLYVPVRTVTIMNAGYKRKYPARIRKLQSRKAAAWRVYRRGRSSHRSKAYKARSAQYRTAIRSHVTECESRLVDNGNLGAFYRYCNNKLASRAALGPLVNGTGHTITNSAEKANLLNDVFCT